MSIFSKNESDEGVYEIEIQACVESLYGETFTSSALVFEVIVLYERSYFNNFAPQVLGDFDLSYEVEIGSKIDIQMP